MSRRELQQIKWQAILNQYKAIFWRVAVAMVCLIAVTAAAVLWGGFIFRAAAQGTTTGIWEDVAESSIPNRGQREVMPRAYRTLRLNKDALRALLADAPMEFTRQAKAAPVTISLPMPDGKFGRFKVVDSPMMEAGLAAKHPDYKTYSGIGVDDPTAITRFGITASGFHAIILAPEGSVYIDPYAMGDTEHYISYYKRDYSKAGEPFICNVTDDSPQSQTRPPRVGPKFVSFGFVRFYRLAMAATSSYTNFFRFPGDTDIQARDRAFDAITTTVNRVNSIFGRDLGVRLVLINNEKDIIYVPGNDPYTAIPGTQAILNENQANLDDEIGNDNYDVGHVVGGNGGGLAQRPSVCLSNVKAKGSTGRAVPVGDPFDVDFFAHEIGHQLNADHTFNNNLNGSCGNANQYVASSAYEPGSGSTVMAYAGICDPADLQPNSDDYFHAKSVEDIRFYVHDPGGDGSTCGNAVPSGNLGLNPSISLIRTIPSQTPFRLYAGDFTDPDPGDEILYTWEEYDLGLPSPPEGDAGDRPLFRSYRPTLDSDRTMPSMQYILNNANTPPVTYNCPTPTNPTKTCLTGETLPVNTRTMFFRLTLRDNRDAVAILDNVTINIDSNSGPFFVFTAPSWPQGAARTVTWGVANTNSPPINCANVKITLSTDGGNNFSSVLAESTPNDGSETIVVPQVITTQARVKVEAVGNIFFDISDRNFSITAPTVTTTDDTGGDNLNPVSGSLREAIIAANNLDGSAGPIPILFNIPGGPTLKTINLQKELPALNNRVFIDGWSQGAAGYTGPPLIELNGQFAQPAMPNGKVTGLTINSGGSGSRVRGLVINRFTGVGVWIFGSSNNIVEGCYIGTDAAGASRLPNGEEGIRIGNGSGNRIGSPGAGLGNVISGNGIAAGVGDGIEIVASSSSGNIVQNNLIGLNAAGTAILHNTGSGVHIIGAPGTIIGGPGSETRNILSGGSVGTGSINGNGVHIEGSTASGTLITGNYIGTNAAGTADLGNNGSGILINNAPNTTIGGLTVVGTGLNERNIISGNNNNGQIYVIGSGSTGTRIIGNYVGLNATGDARIDTGGIIGIRIESSNNTIGGTRLGEGNVISGNLIGIDFNQQGASANVVQGNLIGTDKTGTVDLGNSTGINILRGSNNVIGGPSPSARNLISGNDNSGITIAGDNANPAEGNLIRGNYIGTNAAGTAALGNGAGIVLAVRNVTVGGTTPAEGNLISGNGNSFGSDAIVIGGSLGQGIVVQGNLIGTNATGTAALGNTGNGILINGFVSGVTIGGASPGERNVIAANGQYGINLGGTGGNVVRGNLIGTDATGTVNWRNSLPGIRIASDNNVIGGPGPGEGNVIAFNGVNTNHSGIEILDGGATGNQIRGNSIYSNAGPGIDIGGLGFTPNDSCDADTGANNVQNFPVLSAAVNGAGNIRIEGTLNSTASSTFTLDFYSNPACDSSGNGEGKTYLGSAMVMTAANCIASFTGENAITLGVTVPAGQVVTATATDSAGNTSEFSSCIQVTGLCAAISPVSQSFTQMGGSGSVNVTAAGGCNWTAVSNDAWIIIVSEAGGVGIGVVSYEVRENFAAPSRTGTMTIAEQTLTVTQSGSCTYSIAPTQRTHPASGGPGSINVITANGCDWTAVSNVAWITINGGNGGGNGTATYTVTANPGPGRSGTITVAGQTFTVKQKKG